jgi:iron complex transport system ATP-binding protein
MTLMLSAIGLSYERGRARLLDSIDLSIEGGTFTVIAGPNGAGKTTLLRILCGELSPSQGRVLVQGEPIQSFPAWRLAHKRAVMPQASHLGFPFTVFEVARLGVEGIGPGLSTNERDRITAGSLLSADVSHLAHRSYQTLSGGERQRVHFARVLAQLSAGRTLEQMQVLFLDEPISGLDLKHQIALLRKARVLADAGLTVVAVLHDLQMAASVADRIALLHRGRLVIFDVPDLVLTPNRIANVFGVAMAASQLPPYPWRHLHEETGSADRAKAEMRIKGGDPLQLGTSHQA